jgi:amidase
MVKELLDGVDGDVRASVVDACGHDVVELGVDLDAGARAFRFLQRREAWTEHGAWITEMHPDMGPGIAARFAEAALVTDEEVAWAQQTRDTVRRMVVDATAGGRVLLGPAATGGAPRLHEDPQVRDATRAGTLPLTCLAALAGAPVVVLPLAHDHGLPLGVACLAAPGSDLDLLAWAADRMAA